MTFHKTQSEFINPSADTAKSLRVQAAFCQRNADRCRNTANPRDAQTWDSRAEQYRREAYAIELAAIPYPFETVLTEPRGLFSRVRYWLMCL